MTTLSIRMGRLRLAMFLVRIEEFDGVMVHASSSGGNGSLARSGVTSTALERFPRSFWRIGYNKNRAGVRDCSLKLHCYTIPCFLEAIIRVATSQILGDFAVESCELAHEDHGKVFSRWFGKRRQLHFDGFRLPTDLLTYMR